MQPSRTIPVVAQCTPFTYLIASSSSSLLFLLHSTHSRYLHSSPSDALRVTSHSSSSILTHQPTISSRHATSTQVGVTQCTTVLVSTPCDWRRTSQKEAAEKILSAHRQQQEQSTSSSSASSHPSIDAASLTSYNLFLHRSRQRARAMFDRWMIPSVDVALRSSVTINVPKDASPVILNESKHTPSSKKRMNVHEAIERVMHPGMIQRMREAMIQRRSDLELKNPSSAPSPSSTSSNKPIRFLSSHTILQRWRRILISLLTLGGSSTGNTVEVFNSGKEAFKAMWTAIEEAKREICMESYIIEMDGVGRHTLALLTAAAKRGVKVKLCYDSFGSSNLLYDRKELDALKQAGGHVIHFNPITTFLIPLKNAWRGSLRFRNHRKLLIVDQEVGFCGGMNVSDDYYDVMKEAKESDEVDLTPSNDNSVSSPLSASSSAASLAASLISGTGKFRDTHLRVTGPCVRDLLAVSRDTFHEATLSQDTAHHVSDSPNAAKHEKKTTRRRKRKEEGGGWYPRKSHTYHNATHSDAILPPNPAIPSILPVIPTLIDPADAAATAVTCPLPPVLPESSIPSSSSSNLFVQVLPSNIWRNKRTIQRAMLLTIRDAKSHILLTNPYFFPPRSMMRALQTAAERGIRVEIIMAGAGRTDVPVTRWASQHIYHTLLKRGVRIYELHSATLHAKTVTIDSIYSSIGSFNWDRLSTRRNLEVNLTVLDPDIARVMESHFSEDRRHSSEVTLETLNARNFLQRLLHRVAYLVMRYT